MRSIFENIVASLLLALIGFVAFSLGLSRAERFDDPSNWPLWLVVLGGATALFFIGNALRLLDAWRRQRRVRPASGEKTSILLVRLENDSTDGNHREAIREFIRDFFGTAFEIVLWPSALRIEEGHEVDSEVKAFLTARRWLRRSRCDLAIWGRIKGPSVVSLRFATAGASFRPETYRLTETLALPAEFAEGVGAAVAAKVLEKVVEISASCASLQPLLGKVIRQLSPLIQNPSGPFSDDTRGLLLNCYGRLLYEFGVQFKDPDSLSSAIEAFKNATDLNPRATRPSGQ